MQFPRKSLRRLSKARESERERGGGYRGYQLMQTTKWHYSATDNLQVQLRKYRTQERAKRQFARALCKTPIAELQKFLFLSCFFSSQPRSFVLRCLVSLSLSRFYSFSLSIEITRFKFHLGVKQQVEKCWEKRRKNLYVLYFQIEDTLSNYHELYSI